MFFESKLPRYFITLEIITFKSGERYEKSSDIRNHINCPRHYSLNLAILHFIQTCKDVHEFSTQERKRKLIIIVIVMIIIIIVVVKCKNKLRNFKTKEKR